MKKRVVVIGLGDAGLLTAVRLPKNKVYEIVGISSKPCFVSGQALGNRLVDVDEWKQEYWRSYERFRGLDHVRIVHGSVTFVDLSQQRVTVLDIHGKQRWERYDVLLIATGTTNGFWRNGDLESREQIESKLSSQAARFQTAKTIAIVGGGPTAVDAASNLKRVYPQTRVHVFFGRETLLAGYPDKTRDDVERMLREQGVQLHPHHRAKTDGVDIHAIGSGTIQWQQAITTTKPTNDSNLKHQIQQPLAPAPAPAPFEADTILWAVGALRPNNRCLPKELLDEDGFVEVTPELHHPKVRNVFAVGDIASSDPHRSTARNAGFIIAAKNIQRYLKSGGTTRKLRSFHAPNYKWGSVVGLQPKGLRIYSPTGRRFVVRQWFAKAVLFPVAVHKFIYKGIRKPATVNSSISNNSNNNNNNS